MPCKHRAGAHPPEQPRSPLKEAACQPGDRQHHAEQRIGDVEPFQDERVHNGQASDIEMLDTVTSGHDPERPAVSRRAQQSRLPRRLPRIRALRCAATTRISYDPGILSYSLVSLDVASRGVASTEVIGGHGLSRRCRAALSTLHSGPKRAGRATSLRRFVGSRAGRRRAGRRHFVGFQHLGLAHLPAGAPDEVAPRLRTSCSDASKSRGDLAPLLSCHETAEQF